MPKSKLTPKENYLRLAKGEIPEYIPVFTMGAPGYMRPPSTITVGPSLLCPLHPPPTEACKKVDPWGVTLVSNEETNFAFLPEPNNFILEDITKWRDIIKKPAIPENIDWEMMAKKDIEASGLDRTQSAAMATINIMPFQQVIAYMGFNNGLMAIYEEPECFEELLNFLTDQVMPIVHATLDYYDPDIMYLLDDTAAEASPFISPDTYRTLLKPVYKRLLQPAIDRGVPIQYHNCGKCEVFTDDMIDLGIKIWDPAQVMNDLDAVKKKYGRDLAICGGYKWSPPSTWPVVYEEEIRQSARDTIDRFAPDGGFAFFAGALGRHGDKTIEQVNMWLADEAYHYGMDYYLK